MVQQGTPPDQRYPIDPGGSASRRIAATLGALLAFRNSMTAAMVVVVDDDEARGGGGGLSDGARNLHSRVTRSRVLRLTSFRLLPPPMSKFKEIQAVGTGSGRSDDDTAINKSIKALRKRRRC